MTLNTMFLPATAEGIPTFGSPTPCPHCGGLAPAREMMTPGGRVYHAHYPSDTCCREKAIEAFRTNLMYMGRYRASKNPEDHKEVIELESRNREITRIMRAKGLS